MKNFYNIIKNPLNNDEIICQLIMAYANSRKTGISGMYGQLTRIQPKKYNNGEHYISDSDRFYSMMFNMWKNKIINMDDNGERGRGFIKLKKFLMSIPDVKTERDANNIFNQSYQDEELQEAMNLYRWTAYGEGTSWTHVKSSYFKEEKKTLGNIKHRLYLNTESLVLYPILCSFITECHKNNLPYYLKFKSSADRDDSFVIYADTDERLINYINILQKIKQQNPQIMSNIKEPPILTGEIDGWIGYGSEPITELNGEQQSFNSIRAELLEKAIDQETKKWIKDHKDFNVKSEGIVMSIQDYIAREATYGFIERLKHKFIAQRQYNKTDAQIGEEQGYTLYDLQSPQFRDSVWGIIKNYMPTILPQVCNEKGTNMNSIKMKVRRDKKIIFTEDILQSTIRDLSLKIVGFDPRFIPLVRNAIKEKSSQYGIDPENFCFNLYRSESKKGFTGPDRVGDRFKISYKYLQNLVHGAGVSSSDTNALEKKFRRSKKKNNNNRTR